jgi:hypothetical protein
MFSLGLTETEVQVIFNSCKYWQLFMFSCIRSNNKYLIPKYIRRIIKKCISNPNLTLMGPIHLIPCHTEDVFCNFKWKVFFSAYG